MPLPLAARAKPSSGDFNVFTNYQTGSDTTGDGSESLPFKTAQHALHYNLDQLDLTALEARTTLVINLAPNVADLTTIHYCPHAPLGAQGGTAITIRGGIGSRLIHSSPQGGAIELYRNATVNVENLGISSGQYGITASWGAFCFVNNVDFYNCSYGSAMHAGAHSEIDLAGPITVRGGFNALVSATDFGIFNSNGYPITATENVQWNAAMIAAYADGRVKLGASVVTLNPGVTAAGKKWTCDPDGRISANGRDLNAILPGTSNGP